MSDDQSLYGISDEFQRLDELLAETGGELTEETEAKEAELLEFLTKKVDGCCGYVQKLNDQIKNAQEAKKRLDDFMRVRKNKADNFKEYIRRCMKIAGKDVFEGDLYAIDTTKGREKLIIDAGVIDSLPLEFIKTEISEDKAKLESAIKAGQTIKGVRLERQEPNIRIGLKKGSKRKPKAKEVKDATVPEQSNETPVKQSDSSDHTTGVRA